MSHINFVEFFCAYNMVGAVIDSPLFVQSNKTGTKSQSYFEIWAIEVGIGVMKNDSSFDFDILVFLRTLQGHWTSKTSIFLYLIL